MEAFCWEGHRWSVALAVTGLGDAAATGDVPVARGWACPLCAAPAVVVHRVGGVEISFTVPADIRVVSGVLLVDANERRRDALARAIDGSEHLCVVGHAADGTDALELAGLIRPDAVVLAERMPRLDGLSCLRRLAAAAPDALVVFHDERLDQQLVRLACERGADACVDETVIVDVAVETLERLLGRTAPVMPVVTRHLARPA